MALTERIEAMTWWNNLRIADKVKQKNKFPEFKRRPSDSLTGREIQKIFENVKR